VVSVQAKMLLLNSQQNVDCLDTIVNTVVATIVARDLLDVMVTAVLWLSYGINARRENAEAT